VENKVFYDHHVHSHFSLNDCIIKIPELVLESKKMGRKSVTLTDHGTLAGLYELHTECKKQDLKPILGLEGYFVDSYENDSANIPYNYAHVLLIAKNEIGWVNLKEIQSAAWENGFLKKPRIDFNLLSKFHEGLICSTACYHGLVGWNFVEENDKYYGDEKIKKRKKIIRKRIKKFSELFSDDFYMEIQYNELEKQRGINQFIISLAKKLGVKILATGDCHYLKRRDDRIHDLMICNFRRKLLSDSDNGTYSTRFLYLKNLSKMKITWMAWHDDYISEEVFNESMETSIEIHEKVEKFPLKPNKICIPDFKNPKEQMIKWVNEGLKNKLTVEQRKSQKYIERLKSELEVFHELKMETYMLVCADINKRAKKEGIPVGPGRGSVCGSLVAFLMDITQIDPIRFDTSFDRFLIKTRLSLPDIDMDFGRSGREKIKEIVKNLYGEDNFSVIAAYGVWKPRGAIKDVGKVLGYPFSEMNEVTKKISDRTKSFDDEETPVEPEVQEWLEENNQNLYTS